MANFSQSRQLQGRHLQSSSNLRMRIMCGASHGVAGSADRTNLSSEGADEPSTNPNEAPRDAMRLTPPNKKGPATKWQRSLCL